MSSTSEEWTPKTREDWVNLFADGQLKAHSVREEAEAKAKAAEAEAAAKTGKGDGDNTGDAKPSFRERILGL